MRNDPQLQSDVRAELRFDPAIDDTDVRVAVAGGVVTLTGTVPSFADKIGAAHAVERVFGVKAVANDLAVAVPIHLEQPDTAIAKAVVNALEWDVLVPGQDVKGSVSDGWVTLEGRVDWRYQRDAAARAVRNLSGVRGVTNNIFVVAKPVAELDVSRSIKEALERRADRTAERIHVQAINGVVTLSGSVPSFGDRRAAEGAAWSASGVTDVHDELIVKI